MGVDLLRRMKKSGLIAAFYSIICLSCAGCSTREWQSGAETAGQQRGNGDAETAGQQRGNGDAKTAGRQRGNGGAESAGQQHGKDLEGDDDDEFMFGDTNVAQDPLEPMNRAVFSFNSAFDKVIFAPLAKTYRRVLPQRVQDAARNVVSTFFAPIRLLNFTLQGEGKQAAKTVFRFAYNILFGFFGMFDAAKEIGITTPNTGFADTFKKWGMPPGPYFVLPVLGPSSMRGSFGKIFDFPLTSLSDSFVPSKKQATKTSVRYLMTAEDLLIARVDMLDIFDDIEKMSTDKYTATRSAVMAMEK
ncbi:MAG: VacJ family lipoprotein [Holosporales bacterium]|jgi:phospholipid-binding lipoprotein MlaA|nr:VacJ family lipoprotein [Holosporales bacterium]